MGMGSANQPPVEEKKPEKEEKKVEKVQDKHPR